MGQVASLTMTVASLKQVVLVLLNYQKQTDTSFVDLELPPSLSDEVKIYVFFSGFHSSCTLANSFSFLGA